MYKTGIETVIFDLGGVLADFGGVGPMRDLSGIDSDEEIWRRWLTCDWVRRFERGACSADDFASGVVADWNLPIAPTAFLELFGRWIASPLPGAEDLVEEVAQRHRVACLNNTNSLHWGRVAAAWPLMELFDFRFLSFEVGLVKPDPEVFDHVCATLKVEPRRVLFLDDNLINVEAARAAGLGSVQVHGVGQARTALRSAGLL